MATWYYCPQHMPGVDPQTLEMYADIYGWGRVQCPHYHSPSQLPRPVIPAWDLALIAFFYFCVPAILCAAFNWQPVGMLKINK